MGTEGKLEVLNAKASRNYGSHCCHRLRSFSCHQEQACDLVAVPLGNLPQRNGCALVRVSACSVSIRCDLDFIASSLVGLCILVNAVCCRSCVTCHSSNSVS